MTRASDLAKLLGAGATINDGTTITTADNTDQLTLISTDADANVGPNLNLFRNSGSPADDDVLGLIIYNGRNDNSQDVIYARQVSYIKDASDGTEDGQLTLQTMVAGTIRDRLNINPTEIALNEDSQDLDFRVEGNGNTHALFVEGSSDRVGIGTSSMAEPLRVQADSGTDFSASGAAFNNAIMLKNATAGAANTVSLAMATETNGEVYLSTVQNSGNNAADFVISTRASGARAERLRVAAAGHVTKPNQPRFSASGSSVTASGNVLKYQQVAFDVGSNYSTSTGRFTAPVAGTYIFYCTAIGASEDDVYRYYTRKNGTTYPDTETQMRLDVGSGGDYGYGTSAIIMVMDASDYAEIYFGSDGGNATHGSSSSGHEMFSGYLLF